MRIAGSNSSTYLAAARAVPARTAEAAEAADTCTDPKAALAQGARQGFAWALQRSEALPPAGEPGSARTWQQFAAARGASSCSLARYFLDLASGTHAGPKPASVLAAENLYLSALKASG